VNWEEIVFCVVDTETTGTDPFSGDRIIEIAAVPVYKGKIYLAKSFHSLVNSHVRVPALIQKIHGISNDEIESAPDMKEVYESFREYVKDTMLVFHNAEFDLTFLDMMAKDTGNFPLENPYVDTLDLSRELFGKAHSLKWLCEKLKIKGDVKHRALEDAHLTAKVFLRMMSLLGEENIEQFVKRKGRYLW